jgi:hypothetical protein
MHRGSCRVYYCILDLPQHVSASYCHHQGVVVTSDATQAICVVGVYGLRFVQCGQLTTDRTGINLECINKSNYFLDAFVRYFTTILQKSSVQLPRLM